MWTMRSCVLVTIAVALATSHVGGSEAVPSLAERQPSMALNGSTGPVATLGGYLRCSQGSFQGNSTHSFDVIDGFVAACSSEAHASVASERRDVVFSLKKIISDLPNATQSDITRLEVAIAMSGADVQLRISTANECRRKARQLMCRSNDVVLRCESCPISIPGTVDGVVKRARACNPCAREWECRVGQAQSSVNCLSCERRANSQRLRSANEQLHQLQACCCSFDRTLVTECNEAFNGFAATKRGIDEISAVVPSRTRGAMDDSITQYRNGIATLDATLASIDAHFAAMRSLQDLSDKNEGYRWKIAVLMGAL